MSSSGSSLRTIRELVEMYDARASLDHASTIPAPWYLDEALADLEQRTVFSRNWQVVGRVEQLAEPGQYLTTEIAGEPIVVIRGDDGRLRSFFNVCRHHAAAVMTESEGLALTMRCPYHGWTYGLDGRLRGVPEFAGVCAFDQAKTGLIEVECDVWQKWVFIKLESGGKALPGIDDFKLPGLESLRFFARRRYRVESNWKVYVDNYLDGGYHVPHIHKGLASVLDYSQYKIANGRRFTLQSSPVVEGQVARGGKEALYYWVYPNFMINWYEGVMDTNVVIPCGTESCDVVFDYYFSDPADEAQKLMSIAVSEQIQAEDANICMSVQRGLKSRAYFAGRLSVKRESGEHLFHRLLYDDLKVD
jgi:phenylpropionate dioxygenase-like ring-hydroxylating dioxygenase large terminal subunit